MMRQSRLLVILLFLLAPWQCQGAEVTDNERQGPQPPEASESPDLAAIREQSGAFVKAFNEGDAARIAELWTEDGEYLDGSGQRYVGREEIRKAYAEFFKENPEHRINVRIESLRQVGPNVAIEDGIAGVDSLPLGVGMSRYTAVHGKSDGKWLMTSVRDSPVEVSEAQRNAADLAWLIGNWVAEEQGVRIESACRWVAGDHFIKRDYTTTLVDGTQTSGVQLIGWNSLNEYVQSWDFSPDGGHAVGVWRPVEGGWMAEVHGMTGDGITTDAVNTLRRLDDNAYAWQSTQRFLGDTPLPDTNEVVIKRQPGKDLKDQ
ncbi:YybH family protein [Roseiconus nitratireducens]|nr:SgcJ/EcaC family oxidoreductase [Roseiconus nitratireducens]